MPPKKKPGEHPSGRPLTDVDEVAGRLVLTRMVGIEVSVHRVLHVVFEGLPQQLAEVLQAMRVVGQTEITAEKQRRGSFQELLIHTYRNKH